MPVRSIVKLRDEGLITYTDAYRSRPQHDTFLLPQHRSSRQVNENLPLNRNNTVSDMRHGHHELSKSYNSGQGQGHKQHPGEQPVSGAPVVQEYTLKALRDSIGRVVLMARIIHVLSCVLNPMSAVVRSDS